MRKLHSRLYSAQMDWLKFSGIEFLYWGIYAIANYQTIYLQSIGVSATLLGIINAVMSGVAIALTPMWGMLSDRIRSIRKIFLLTLVVGSLFFSFIPVVFREHDPLPTPILLLYICLTYAFKRPNDSLLDTWLVRYSNDKMLNYGTIRCFGSLGFAIVSAAVTVLIAAYGTVWTFWVSSLLFLTVVALSMFTDDAAAQMPARHKEESVNPLPLFRDYRYTTFLVFALLMWLVCGCYVQFIPYRMVELNIPTSQYGFVGACIAVLEIPMLLAATPLRRRIPLYVLAAAATLCQGITCLLLCVFVRDFSGLMMAMCIGGLGSGLLIASCSNYVFTLLPVHLKATGLSIYITVSAAAGIIGSLAGGRLIDTFGTQTFYAVLFVVDAIATVLLPLSLFIGKKAHLLPKEE